MPTLYSKNDINKCFKGLEGMILFSTGVLKANREHKKFIIHANNVINNVNDTEQTNGLEQNIDK